MKAEGTGEICLVYVKVIFIYCTIFRAENIVHYTEDFVV